MRHAIQDLLLARLDAESHARDEPWPLHVMAALEGAPALASALVDPVVTQAGQRGLALYGYSPRAQLLCLRAHLRDGDLAGAQHAWSALTRACHHHPYELAPVVGELEGWLTAVEIALAAVREARE